MTCRVRSDDAIRFRKGNDRSDHLYRDEARGVVIDEHGDTKLSDPIPQSVHRLVVRRITSISQLEILITLVQDDRWWSLDELVVRMVLTADHIAVLLTELTAAGLVEVDGDRYRFVDNSPADAKAAAELAELYGRYRLRIQNIVYSGAVEHAREP